jgi:V8-like Glu-specific endopeptidase
MTAFRAVVPIGWLAATWCGCGPPPEDAQAAESSPIIGGEPDPGDPSVVALFGEGTEGSFLCTGAVIAPTVILTAAHCVAAEETGAGARFVVLTGGNVNHSGRERLAVREVHANPRWRPQALAAGHDQGVVILEHATALAPLPYLHQPLAASAVGRMVRIVGYGLTSGTAGTGAGIKRQALTSLRAISDTLLEVGNAQRSTCNGDSGGPAFMTVGGVETIVGTTSFGNAQCTDGGYDARVDTDLAFIERYLPAGCRPACAQRSCGSDGCGGSCGACGRDEICTSEGRCQPIQAGCGAGGVEQEPNDSALLANPLCAGGRVEGTLGSASDTDWYSFSVGAGTGYEAALEGGGESATLSVYKRSVAGRLSFVGEGSRVSRHSEAGGTYLVRVTGPGGGPSSYRLTVRGSP